MKEWMKISDLSEYLQVPESRIRYLVKQERIPFHDSHGFIRFYRQEIDKWMKQPTRNQEEVQEATTKQKGFLYRGNPITQYTLTATIILIGETPWSRLPKFVGKAVNKIANIDRDYLYHEEFNPFLSNFNDYLRVSCQLGLIENKKEDERKKHYYPTKYAQKIAAAKNNGEIRQIILDSILYHVRNNLETKPNEKHSILLLWYFLKLREKGIEPEESHFRLSKDKRNNYFPQIRLGFIKSLCYFLFKGNEDKEEEFISKWNKLL